MKELKELEDPNMALDSDIPRAWQLHMNHLFHKGQQASIRSFATRVPTTWQPEELYCASVTGPDLLTEVPLTRWSHDEWYDEDADCWKQQKVWSKHGSFYEGVELFDAKMFSISMVEARGMDPCQRQILEVGYEALAKAGMDKRKIMNSGGAVYVGAGMTEWNNVPKDLEGGAFGATGGSLAITSNRFSYCMGMKGPSMSADCHSSASLVAVYMGYQNVMRESTVSDYSLSSGVYVMMWPSSWVADVAAGFMVQAAAVSASTKPLMVTRGARLPSLP
jgi:acyl transferase domain-containing protein